jgi:hypothetical protein
VAQHRAFGTARRSGRVDDGGEVIGTARNDCFARSRGQRFRPEGARLVGSENIDPQAGDIATAGPHEHTRLCIRQEVSDFGVRVGRVERDEHGACPQAAEVEGDRSGRLLDLRDDAIPRRDSPRSEHARHARRHLLETAVREDAASR